MCDCKQNVASLSQLFYVGKLVRCKILNVTTKRSKKIVSLTINPKDVNKDVKPLKSGMVSCTLNYNLICDLIVFVTLIKTQKTYTLLMQNLQN